MSVSNGARVLSPSSPWLPPAPPKPFYQTALGSARGHSFWPNTNRFLERRVASAQMVISSFIVSETIQINLITAGLKKKKRGQSSFNVAVILCAT